MESDLRGVIYSVDSSQIVLDHVVVNELGRKPMARFAPQAVVGP
jgi:hypothetical protein